MRVVGKTSILKGMNKVLMRFILHNGEKFYRLVFWEARLYKENTTELCDLYYQLKIGRVRFFKIVVQFLYLEFYR